MTTRCYRAFLAFTGILLAATLALPGAAVAAKPGGSTSSGTKPKNAFNIMMNYELGMHCTGFEFSYCCVLPPYNSILAQVVKTRTKPDEWNGGPAPSRSRS